MFIVMVTDRRKGQSTGRTQTYNFIKMDRFWISMVYPGKVRSTTSALILTILLTPRKIYLQLMLTSVVSIHCFIIIIFQCVILLNFCPATKPTILQIIRANHLRKNNEYTCLICLNDELLLKVKKIWFLMVIIMQK